MNLFVEKKPDNIKTKEDEEDNNKNYTPLIIAVVAVIFIVLFVSKSSFMPMPERDDLIHQFSVADEFRKIHNTQDQFFK